MKKTIMGLILLAALLFSGCGAAGDQPAETLPPAASPAAEEITASPPAQDTEQPAPEEWISGMKPIQTLAPETEAPAPGPGGVEITESDGLAGSGETAERDEMAGGEGSGPDAPAGGADLAPLEELLNAELSRLSSKWDLWVEELAGGSAVHCFQNVEAGTPMISASLIKLFIMGAVYQRIEDGELAEADVKSDLSYMITISDNYAANRLTRLLGGGDGAAGMQAVNEWAAALGCESVALNRLMLEENGLQNYVTAQDCALLLRQIYRGELVSPQASEKMLALLRAQEVNDRIPAGLSGGAAAAHKTGNLYGICVADVGIVFSPYGDYILCVICNSPYSDAGATQEIVSLSAMVLEYFSTHSGGQD